MAQAALEVVTPMKDPFEIYKSPANDDGEQSKVVRHLDWEEGAMDEQSPVEGFADAAAREPLSTRSLRGLYVAFGLVGAILVIKLFSLQIVQGGKYMNLAEGNRLRIQTILAPRGQIIDRTGAVLARNTASFSLVATPVDLPKANLDNEISQLSQLLHLDEAEVRDKLANYDPHSFQPIILKQDLAQQDSILFQTNASQFPGFGVDSIPIRDYPAALTFSHLLGYTGVISPAELGKPDNQGYRQNDFIGKLGIELSYEKYLRGIDGERQVEVDASGRPVKVLGNLDPQPGDVVQLSINQGLQQVLYDSFIKHSPKVRGAAVALNPKTGEVLALLSLPGFDNNLFAQGISSVDYQKLTSDASLPLFNRAISGTYPPGSTSKLMAATAALQEGIVTPSTVIVDRGVLVVPNQFIPGQEYRFNGWKPQGLGPMTVRSAIAQSSDIFFYTTAGGQPGTGIDGLGAEKLAAYYRKFGLGNTLGIDLQGEKPGLVPDPAWKEQYFKGDPIQAKWYLGDTYHIGIGQGDMLTTPLQVAEWTAIIANNGTGYQPVILKQVTDQSGKVLLKSQPKTIISNVASPDVIKVVQEGMREAVTSGTARALNGLPVTSAGKTGTSQFDGSDPSRTHAWFTVYAPYENPQLVITVLVEAGGEGNAVAEPIAQDALAWCIKNNCFNQ
jgi:penicillin-binding protein 2